MSDMRMKADKVSDVLVSREVHEAEIGLAKQMAEILMRLYPGHRWATAADSRGRILRFTIPALMAEYWEIEDIDLVQDYPAMCKWLKAKGGEMLERWRLARGKFDMDTFEEAHKKRIVNMKMAVPE